MFKELRREQQVDSKSNDVVIKYYTASWCQPCAKLRPVLEKLCEENENIDVVKIDIDEHAMTSNTIGILSVPTLQYFKNGSMFYESRGPVTKMSVKNTLKEAGIE